nr:hypothetical protein [Clostridia bacterium]
YNAGARKLLNEMLNGLYKPDIITASTVTDMVLGQVYDYGLYTDLYPFIDTSTKIKRDDILGCVDRTFGTSDGKLWAIGANFSVQTLIGPESVLGKDPGWTLSEFIEFAESLDEDVLLMEGLTRDSASRTLLGANGYGMFIDRGTNKCDFENPEFIRYLNFLKTLPATYEEADALVGVEWDQRYKLYHSGKIALRSQSYYGLNDIVSEEARFNTKDVNRIGYPTKTEGEVGTYMDIAPYVITSFCEYPAEAWSFIENLIAPEKVEGEQFRSGRDGYPILKSALDELFKEYYTYFFEVDISGNGMSWGEYNPEHNRFSSDHNGYQKFFTKEDAAEVLDWLDNVVGTPIEGQIDPDLAEIIDSEITDYLGGVRSAEECARMIQSRAGLWLAEHE